MMTVKPAWTTTLCLALGLGLIACGGSSSPDVADADGTVGESDGTAGAGSEDGGNGAGGVALSFAGSAGRGSGQLTGGRAGGVTCGVNDAGCEFVAEGPACGDGKVDDGEACDDGNGLPGDGCTGACTVEPFFECPAGGGSCTFTVECGDGVVEGGEVCDDGPDHRADGDGCSADCLVRDPKFDCSTPGVACMPLEVCGNSVVEGTEACDDGEATPDDGDGCSADCGTIESGFTCPANGGLCSPITFCGDGVVQDDEECDDGNRGGGDGCNAACKTEPFYDCPASGGACTFTVVCGDGMLEAFEVCDDGPDNVGDGNDGCSTDCLSKDPEFDCSTPGMACVDLVVCGDGQITGGERCDDGDLIDDNGCSADCSTIADGFVCLKPGDKCFVPRTPECGDGFLDPGEECDDGDKDESVRDGDGCDSTCALETGGGSTFVCVTPGQACIEVVCGNGTLEPGEECDDGAANAGAGDGCNDDCEVEANYVCATPGKACTPRCNDAVLLAPETCEDGNLTDGDGCSSTCQVEPGYFCAAADCTVGEAPTAAVCGNSVTEADEGCDDGNDAVGDGCTPWCTPEPTFTNGLPDVVCGDGVKLPGEACDDGNLNDGDGCDSSCEPEDGFVCTEEAADPDFVELPITYRDFEQSHPDMQRTIEDDRDVLGSLCTLGNVGTSCNGNGNDCCGLLDGTDKLPIYNYPGESPGETIESPTSFNQWYRDVGGTNITFTGETVRLDRIADGVYQLDDNSFFPLNGRGFEDGESGNNFFFTSELRYFFQYEGGELLEFDGDDDVFVYINGRLAVDLGGVHGAQEARVLLGDEDWSCSPYGGGGCSLSTAEQADDTDDRFGLQKGQLYEIALFHAERHRTQSNFKLTLSGFIFGRSVCLPDCGDGEIVRGEVCDDGDDNGTGYGFCNSTCSGKEFCGDGTTQDPDEACDNGQNTDGYGVTTAGACSPGCQAPPFCGNAALDAAFGEACDAGPANVSSGAAPAAQYDQCLDTCQRGPFCGDGTIDGFGGETCDDGAGNIGYGVGCGYDCRPAPRCGDGVLDPVFEECDAGVENVSASATDAEKYGQCLDTCQLGPRCGDGTPDAALGEECDDGLNFGGYQGCTPECKNGPDCGDGVPNGPEACDAGGDNVDPAAALSSRYDACLTSCELGPYCGDGSTDDGLEICDDGPNNGRYGFCSVDCQTTIDCGDGIRNGPEECDDGENDGGYGECQAGCVVGPRCGDGVLQMLFGEECDDGTNGGGYGKCQPGCVVGPRCGDGILQPTQGEACDDGVNDGGYGECAPGCVIGPRCGDAVVQGAAGEECDDGNTVSGDGCSQCKREILVPQ